MLIPSLTLSERKLPTRSWIDEIFPRMRTLSSQKRLLSIDIFSKQELEDYSIFQLIFQLLDECEFWVDVASLMSSLIN